MDHFAVQVFEKFYCQNFYEILHEYHAQTIVVQIGLHSMVHDSKAHLYAMGRKQRQTKEKVLIETCCGDKAKGNVHTHLCMLSGIQTFATLLAA